MSYAYQGALLTQTVWGGAVRGYVNYTYDNDFRIASVSVNFANPFAYGYDADSLLTSVGNTALGIDYILSRSDQNGLLTGTTLGSITDSYTYDGFVRDKLGRIRPRWSAIRSPRRGRRFVPVGTAASDRGIY